MIVPTVGRQVWYYRAGADPVRDQPQAATVVKVISESSVCLAILDDCGQLQPFLKPTPFLLVQDGVKPPEGGNYCCWPPRHDEPTKDAGATPPKVESDGVHGAM